MPIPDLSKLGLRQRKVRVFKSVSDPQTQLKQMRYVDEIVTEAQPILTPEEAETLKDEPWELSPPHEKQYGKYRCNVAGYGFFCSVDPSVKLEKPKEKKDK